MSRRELARYRMPPRYGAAVPIASPEIVETLRIIAALAARPPADFPTTLAKIAELASDQLARLET